MSVNQEPNLRDIPISGIEPSLTIINADIPSSTASDRLFSLSTEAEIEANENFIFIDATKLRDDSTELEAQQTSNSMKQSKNARKSSKDAQEMSNTNPSPKSSKLSLKESIFTYWNSIFKRRHSSTSARSSILSNKTLNNKVKSNEKVSDAEKLSSRVLKSIDDVSKLDEPSSSHIYKPPTKKEDGLKVDSENQQASTSKNHKPSGAAKHDECAEWKAQLASESFSGSTKFRGRMHLLTGRSLSVQEVPPSQFFNKQSIKDSIAMYWKNMFKNRHSATAQNNETNSNQQFNNKEDEPNENKMHDEEDSVALKRAVREDL